MNGTIISSANYRLNSALLPGGLLQGTAFRLIVGGDIAATRSLESDSCLAEEAAFGLSWRPGALPLI
jgi:hypothetical protein